MEYDTVKNQLMKTRLIKEYKWHVRKLLPKKLFSKNLILAINVNCISLLCYSGCVVQRTQSELYNNFGCDDKKQFTMHSGFSRNGDIDWFYVPRKLGGRGHIPVCYAVEHERRSLASNVHHSEDAYMSSVARTYQKYEKWGKEYKYRMTADHVNTWREKPLHGQFIWETAENVCGKFQWSWVHSGNCTKEKGLIIAAQEQVLFTYAIRSHIYSLPCSPKCRLHNNSDETVDHLISCFPSLAQREYKQRHTRSLNWLNDSCLGKLVFLYAMIGGVMYLIP